MRMIRLCVWVLALGWHMAPMELNAQTSDNSFCYSWNGYGGCFGSLPEAETAMKAVLPASYRNVIRPKTYTPTGVTQWSTGLEQWRIDYFIPDQPPQQTFARGYYNGWQGAPAVCASAGDPLYPHFCATEAQAVDALYNHMRASYPGCTFVPLGYQNEYASPFGGIQPYNWSSRYGVTSFHNPNQPPAGNRKFLYTMQCPGWNPPDPVVYTINLTSQQTFLCPQDFGPVSGYGASGYAPGGGGTVIGGPLCRPSQSMPYVTYYQRGADSCPAGEDPGPCHPATGDKSRAEIDFEFAGESFIRHYHSRRQTGMLPAFAPGWTHTYSDRVVDGGASNMRIIRGDGNIEYFLSTATNQYKSTYSTRKRLIKNTDGSYTLYDESGRIHSFNGAGRLVRVDRSESGLDRLDLTYDGERLIRVQDETGRGLDFLYTDGRLSSVRQPDGTSVQYEYDALGNFSRAIYADGTDKRYHYNEAGLSLANDPHALTGITLESGLRYSSYGYTSKGRVNLSRRHKGDGTFVEVTTIDYANIDQPVVTLPYGEVVTYNLSNDRAYRRIASTTGNFGGMQSTYPGNGGATRTLGLMGQDTRYVYAPDYLSERIEAFGAPQERKFVTQRDTNYRTTSFETQAKTGTTYAARHRWTFTYNARAQRLTATEVDPATSATRTTTMTYCEQAEVDAGTCPLVGLLRTIDGPRTDVADVTTFAYRMTDHPDCAAAPATCAYRKGDLWTIANALGQTFEVLGFDGNGRLRSVRDANAVVTDYEYDARGRLVAHKQRGPNGGVESDDRIMRLEYWPTGLVKKVIQPDGAFLNFTYDDAQRLIAIADNEGNRIEYALNGASKRIGEEVRDDQGVLLRKVTRTFNTINRMQSQIDAYGRATTFTYTSGRMVDQTTDPLTRTADNNYDLLKRLTRLLEDMNGIAAETKFSYDVLDNLTQVNDPKGLNTNYGYNGFSDLLQLQSPDTGTTTYAYDSAGNRASQADARGVTTTYAYDALNRLTAIAYPTTALNTGFTYDTTQTACATGETFSVGRLTRIDDGSGSTVYCYDRFGQLVRKVQTTNGKTFVLRYIFDVAGRMTSMVYPDGAVVDYVHDAQGRVTEVGATPAGGTRQIVLSNATYYPFGPVAEWSYGNGRVMKRSLNQNYQPGFVEVVGPGGLNLGYEFDQVGNLKKLRTANQAEPPLRVYAYDGLNRLTESRDGSSNALLEGYTYDKTGNRTSATVGAATTPYAYPVASHRLDTVGSTARSYDAAGNTLQIGGAAKSFLYDDRNRMRQYLESGIVKRNYDYNGRGEQVRRWLAANDDRYSVYDEGGQWLGEYDAAGAPLQQIVWLGSLPIAMLNGSGANQKLHYIEADALGTPRVVIDPTRGTLGTAVWRWELTGEAFGNTAPNQDPDGDSITFVFDMRFPGQRYDGVSGLNYNYFRDYEFGVGRYAQSDPIGLHGGVSTYGYVNASPFLLADKNGLESIGPWTFPPGPQRDAYERGRKFPPHLNQNFALNLTAVGILGLNADFGFAGDTRCNFCVYRKICISGIGENLGVYAGISPVFSIGSGGLSSGVYRSRLYTIEGGKAISLAAGVEVTDDAISVGRGEFGAGGGAYAGVFQCETRMYCLSN